MKKLLHIITAFFNTIVRAIGNHIRWHRVLCIIHPSGGYYGLLKVMKQYLSTHINYHDKCNSERAINAEVARGLVQLIEQAEDPVKALTNRVAEIKASYPALDGIVSMVLNEGEIINGSFIRHGDGWVGILDNDPSAEGYFEIIDGNFTVSESPNTADTKRLLILIKRFRDEIQDAYDRADTDIDTIHEIIGELLVDYLYS